MSTLVIVESPAKAKKITGFLGAGYTVLASKGHVRDLPENDIGVAAPDFKPRYVKTDKGKTVLETLAKAAAGASTVLLATDPDREGEAIAWHLREALKLPKAKRVTFKSIEAPVIKKGVAEPREIDMDLVRAQECRRVLDRLVGYQVSPKLCDRLNQRVSAGRVQTPAVRLVVDREREIQSFKSTQHYGAELHFPGGWRAAWDTAPHLPKEAEYFLDAAFAERVAGIRHVTVAEFGDGQSKKAPPAPFITSTLQQAASTKLKMKPAATMKAAQALFDNGRITYHRTDNPNLDAAGIEDVANYARSAGLPLAPAPRSWKSKEGAQEGHEAIRPTHADVLDAGESPEERALYKLIWERTVASQLADAVFAVRKAQLVAELDGQPVTFVARGATLTDPGWKSIYQDDDDNAKDEPANPVPALAVGQGVIADDGKLLSKATKAPKRFTQASLVKELEDQGIGRPSTYAAILSNIESRGYISEDAKGFLSPSQTAFTIIDALAGRFAFAELAYTRDVEAQLDRIAEGKAGYLGVVSAANEQLDRELASLAGVAPVGPVHECPTCKQPMRRRAHGKTHFWGCTAYPECRTTLPDKNGEPVARVAPPADAPRCKACDKPLRRNTKAGKSGYDFFGCTGFPTCKTTYKVGPDGKPVYPAT